MDENHFEAFLDCSIQPIHTSAEQFSTASRDLIRACACGRVVPTLAQTQSVLWLLLCVGLLWAVLPRVVLTRPLRATSRLTY